MDKWKTYKVVCLQCEGASIIKVFGDAQVMYVDHSPIIACRKRPDMKWGFECICGNDSRLAQEEKKDVGLLVQGAEHVVARILKTIDVKPEKKFRMETA